MSGSRRTARGERSGGSASSKRSALRPDAVELADGVDLPPPMTASAEPSATRLQILLAMVVGSLGGAAAGAAIVSSRPDPVAAERQRILEAAPDERQTIRDRYAALEAMENRDQVVSLAREMQSANAVVRNAATTYADWEREQSDAVRISLQGLDGASKIAAVKATLDKFEEASRPSDRSLPGTLRFEATEFGRLADALADAAGLDLRDNGPLQAAEVARPEEAALVKAILAIDRLSPPPDDRPDRREDFAGNLRDSIDTLTETVSLPPRFRMLPSEVQPDFFAILVLQNVVTRFNEYAKSFGDDDGRLRDAVDSLPTPVRADLLSGSPSTFRRDVLLVALVDQTTGERIELDYAGLLRMQDRIRERALELFRGGRDRRDDTRPPRGRFGPPAGDDRGGRRPQFGR